MVVLAKKVRDAAQGLTPRKRWRCWLPKAGQYLLVVLLIVLFNFTLPRLMPGDPTDSLTGTDVDAPYTLDEETRERLLEYHGLDRPLPIQFLNYIANIARCDLGYAIYYKCPVTDLVGSRLPWTLLLAGTAFVLSTAAGVLLGAVAAFSAGSRLDRTLTGALLGIRAMPAYLLGMLAIIVFSVALGAFPLGGATSPFATYSSPLATAADILWHMMLPLAVLTIAQIAGVFLTMRNAIVSVLGETYMLMAEAKGLPVRRRVFSYGMRNAILPLYSRVGVRLWLLATGTIFIEKVFNYPGMGRLAYEATMVHDYPVLQGIFLVTALAIVSANILVDATYWLVDPRAKQTGGEA